MRKQQQEWWKYYFNEDYVKIYQDILTPEITKKQVDFLVKKIKKPHAHVLDVGCGFGRHALELTKRGFQVVGVDFSQDMIARAKEEANAQSLDSVQFLHMDIRELSFSKEFDVALSLFTSFGYFEKDEDHLLVLCNIARALRDEGQFFLELNNGMHTSTWLKREGEETNEGNTLSREDMLSNGLKVRTTHTYFPEEKRLITTRTWKEGGKKKQYTASIRLFSLEELSQLFDQCNLSIASVWSTYEGKKFTGEEPRMLVLAKKEPLTGKNR